MTTPVYTRSPHSDKFAPGVERVIFIDSIHVLLPNTFTVDERRQLEEAAGRPLGKPHPTPPFARRAGWYWSLTLHQPTRRLMRALGALRPTHKLSRVDIACDLLIRDRAERRALHRVLKRHVVIQPRRTPRLWDCFGTTFFGPRGCARNLVIYDGRDSKVAPGRALHIELRLTRTSTCERAGLGQLGDLTRQNTHRVFSTYIRLYEIDDPDAFDAEVQKAFRGGARKKLRMKLFGDADAEDRWHTAPISSLLHMMPELVRRHLKLTPINVIT